MKKSILLFVGIILLTACQNYQYDHELQKKIENQGQKKTEAWFKKHLPEAQNVTIETVYQIVWNYITNMTEGTFTLENDSISYRYVYNWESDSCLTSIGVQDTLEEKTVMWGCTISNQTQFPYTHKTKLRIEPFSESYDLLPFEE